MDVRLLGPLEVTSDGGPIEIGRGKERTLLALLALHAREVVSGDRIVDALWGESPPASALNSVHVYVSQLRKAIGDGRIVTRGAGYMLMLEAAELDTDRFEHLLAQGRTQLQEGDAGGAAATLREALALWRGPALDDVAFEAFAQGEIARLEELRLVAREERIHADLILGGHAVLVPELAVLVRRHPLRERLLGQLMLALYRSGRQADALAVYQDARSTFVEELGLEPGRELQELEQAILRQDPELELPPRPLPRILSRRTGGSLVAVGAALLLGAAIAVAIVELTGGESEARAVAVQPNSVIAVDPRTGDVVAEVPVGEHPSSIATGEGFVWVVNGADRTVSRIDPAGMHAVRTIGVEATPTDVAAGLGAVWVATSENTVLRLDPRAFRVKRSIVLPAPRFGPEDSLVLGSHTRYVAVGAGSVWVGAYTRGSIWRIDPTTSSVVATIHADAGAIAVDQGKVWVTGLLNVTEIDPESNTVRGTVPMSLGDPNIAAGEGFVWVAAGPVWRISPRRHAVDYSIDVGNSSAVSVGHGSLWVASAGDGTVTRLDPSTGEVLVQLALDSSPTDVAVGGDLVWVGVG